MLLIVRHFFILVGFILSLAPALAFAQATQEITIWSCRDKDGRTHVTNLKEDTTGKNCKVVQQSRVQVVPAASQSARPAATTPPCFGSAAPQRERLLSSRLRASTFFSWTSTASLYGRSRSSTRA